jgi:hypothetical protein
MSLAVQIKNRKETEVRHLCLFNKLSLKESL